MLTHNFAILSLLQCCDLQRFYFTDKTFWKAKVREMTQLLLLRAGYQIPIFWSLSLLLPLPHTFSSTKRQTMSVWHSKLWAVKESCSGEKHGLIGIPVLPLTSPWASLSTFYLYSSILQEICECIGFIHVCRALSGMLLSNSDLLGRISSHLMLFKLTHKKHLLVKMISFRGNIFIILKGSQEIF